MLVKKKSKKKQASVPVVCLSRKKKSQEYALFAANLQKLWYIGVKHTKIAPYGRLPFSVSRPISISYLFYVVLYKINLKGVVCAVSVPIL